MTRNGNDTPPAEEAVLVESADAPAEAFEDAPAEEAPVVEEGPVKIPTTVALRARRGYHFDPSVEGVPVITDDRDTLLESDLAEKVLSKDKSRIYIYVVEDATPEETE